MTGSPLLLGTGAQTTPTPPPGDVILDFASGLPANTTLTRASNGIYCTSSGQYVDAAPDTPRLDYDPQGVFLGLMIEPEYTNKVIGNNFDNIPVSAWTGAQGAELVDDTAALAAAGLSTLVPSNQAMRVTADGGQCNNDGQTTNINTHSLVTFARVDTAVAPPGVGGKFQMWDGVGQIQFFNEAYDIIRSDNITPGGADSRVRLGNLASTGGARWVGATMVEDTQSPAYPIPGNAATQALETYTVPQSVVPNGTYNIVYDTPNGEFTEFEQTVSGGWSTDGDAIQALCSCSRVRKITFVAESTPPPDPPPPSGANKFMFGLWGLNGSADAGDPPASYLNLLAPPARGMVRRVPWWRIETSRNVYDWGRCDTAVQDANAKAQEFGYEFQVIFYLEAQTFADLQTNPYTAGPPAYIVDNPEEFGGASNGPGGMWPNRSGGGRWRTSRHHPAFIERWLELYKRAIDRYGDNPAVAGLVINESALSFNFSGGPAAAEFNSFGGGDGYFDKNLQMLTDLKDHGVPFAIVRQSNFWHGARGNSNRACAEELSNHCYNLNQQIGQPFFYVGAPDAVGDSSSQGYSSVYQGYRDAVASGQAAPCSLSLQWQQYGDSTPPNNPYTLVDCTDLSVKDFGGTSVAQWPRVVTRSDANDWTDVLDIYNDRDTGGPLEDPEYVDFLHRGE